MDDYDGGDGDDEHVEGDEFSPAAFAMWMAELESYRTSLYEGLLMEEEEEEPVKKPYLRLVVDNTRD